MPATKAAPHVSKSVRTSALSPSKEPALSPSKRPVVPSLARREKGKPEPISSHLRPGSVGNPILIHRSAFHRSTTRDLPVFEKLAHVVLVGDEARPGLWRVRSWEFIGVNDARQPAGALTLHLSEVGGHRTTVIDVPPPPTSAPAPAPAAPRVRLKFHRTATCECCDSVIHAENFFLTSAPRPGGGQQFLAACVGCETVYHVTDTGDGRAVDLATPAERSEVRAALDRRRNVRQVGIPPRAAGAQTPPTAPHPLEPDRDPALADAFDQA
jgi:hypothetical protein